MVGLTANAPRLLRRVKDRQHAQEEDHEPYSAPKPKRQCREETRRNERDSCPAQEATVVPDNAQRERWSASPISFNSDSADNEQRTDTIRNPPIQNRGNSTPVKIRDGRKPTDRRSRRLLPENRTHTRGNSESDDDDIGFPSRDKPARHVRHKYTTNVHAVAKPKEQNAKSGRKSAGGFQKPPPIPTTRSRDKSSSSFKNPGKKNVEETDATSTESESETDSDLPNDRIFKDAKGPLPKKRSKNVRSQKVLPTDKCFKLPSGYDFDSLESSLGPSNGIDRLNGESTNGTNSSLSSPPESVILDYARESLDLPIHSSQTIHDSPFTTCPVCDEMVERSFLDEFSNYAPRMNVRKQALFCHAHRRQSATEEYKAAGYPDIDWSKFPKRLKRHLGSVRDVLERKRGSWYRERLEERIKGGRLRTLHQTATSTNDETSLQKFVPGYFGTKGARLM